MTGTSSGLRPVFPSDEVLLPAFVDLVATASGAWVNTGLSLVLPVPGKYEISATLHTVIATNQSSGSFNIAIVGRLWNATAGAAVAGSQYTVQQTLDNDPTSFNSDADSATFHRFITVTAPTTIRLEVARINTSGTPVPTTGLQNANTRLAFKKISD
ncbi:hypothetical protein ABZ905_09230 [Streptomyces parvus]|uniref:hypothetical protein n=1 Tax=Streptomyces parvus TaxID=66428 RepID=UPI00340635C3